ncbi:MAG: GNAT family N-acetyltransferase [Thermoplasmata archaeon]|nr:GNAT family N-acetyltransferase [Thermoplasmata archaeon]
MGDAMRAEKVSLRDGRSVTVRPGRQSDAESLLRNVNLVGAEEVYIMMDGEADAESERRWLAEFDGDRNALFVAEADGEVVGSADGHGGSYPKNRHVCDIGIAIRDGWREVGLGRILMTRVIEWMRSRKFEKGELKVFATNLRARRLYESLGFREEGVFRRHIRIRGAYVDEIAMGLWIGD